MDIVVWLLCRAVGRGEQVTVGASVVCLVGRSRIGGVHLGDGAFSRGSAGGRQLLGRGGKACIGLLDVS